MYNLSALPAVDFKTADGKVAVIEGVIPNSTKARAVNGVKVDLAVFDKARVVANFKNRQLERGAAYAVIVVGSGNQAAATWAQSTTKAR